MLALFPILSLTLLSTAAPVPLPKDDGAIEDIVKTINKVEADIKGLHFPNITSLINSPHAAQDVINYAEKLENDVIQAGGKIAIETVLDFDPFVENKEEAYTELNKALDKFLKTVNHLTHKTITAGKHIGSDVADEVTGIASAIGGMTQFIHESINNFESLYL